MSQKDIIEFEKNGCFTFTVDSTPATVEVADVEIISEDIPGWLVNNEGCLTVALDITVTEELRREGIAREIVNRIQNIRKNKDFDITDKIDVVITPNDGTNEAVNDYMEYISKQVLANSFVIADIDEADRIDLEMEEYPGLFASVKRSK